MGSEHTFHQLDVHRSSDPDSKWGRALLPAMIFLATFFAYIDTLVLGFVFDDHVLIVTNESIRSWRYFPTYFTSHIWSFRYPHLLANYYRPLFLTWLRVNHALFGLHPWGWHLTSVLAHVAVTYLVYRLALRLTRDLWVAGFAGTIFGLHPVHAEAVADITSIQEPLSTLFILAAVLAFASIWRLSKEAQWRTEHHTGWLAAALVFTAAALLSKESGMVVPVLICGFAWIYRAENGRDVSARGKVQGLLTRAISALVASFPFWLVVLFYVPARIHALKGFAHVVTALPTSTIIFTIPSVLFFYLRLVFWPFGLSCYYDTPYVIGPGWHSFILPTVLLAAIALVLATWYVRARKSASQDARAIAFACLWMILTLVPVLNFRFLPDREIAHDRYVYLASVGFVILVALALRNLIRYFNFARGRKNQELGGGDSPGLEAPSVQAASDVSPTPGPTGSSRLGWVLALMFLGAMGFVTARQNLFWSDDLTLNYRAHEIAPHNVYATTSLAAAVAEQGMESTAMTLYRQALAVQPKFWRANVNLAYLEYARGNYPEAARYYSIACAADPTDGDQFLYLGMSLLRMGRFEEAENAVRSALLVRPQGKNYHLGLGMVLRGEGKLDEARREIATELAADPQNAQARSLLDQVSREIEADSRETTKSLSVPQGGVNIK